MTRGSGATPQQSYFYDAALMVISGKKYKEGKGTGEMSFE
jgi:hypothetical protein